MMQQSIRSHSPSLPVPLKSEVGSSSDSSVSGMMADVGDDVDGFSGYKLRLRDTGAGGCRLCC